MRRVIVSALALALLPAAVFAQDPPPATQQQPAAPAQPTPPKLAITSPAAVLLIQIKPDQTAVFEEMITKLKAGLAKATDAQLQQQGQSLKVYKAAEPMGPNALYVMHIEPPVADAEYELFQLMSKTMTPEELRAPETAEMWKRYQNAFAAGMSKLSLTPLGGGQ